VHGFAGPIGGSFPAPHGGVCAALLPYATQVNIRALRARASGSETLRRYDEIARILTHENDATGDDAVTWLRTLISELQIPGLRAYGITQKEMPALVGKAAQASSMKANPLVLTKNELNEILELSI
jgi:alcohol dehydrogenase class IV